MLSLGGHIEVKVLLLLWTPGGEEPVISPGLEVLDGLVQEVVLVDRGEVELGSEQRG
jgi:hypothetical protein